MWNLSKLLVHRELKFLQNNILKPLQLVNNKSELITICCFAVISCWIFEYGIVSSRLIALLCLGWGSKISALCLPGTTVKQFIHRALT